MSTPRRFQKITSVVKNRQKGIIVLEDIHDPHNAEAVFRTADAFGFQEIYLIFEKEKPFDPKRVGKVSSASANKWLDFFVFSSTEKCYKELRSKKFLIVATALSQDSQSIYETDLTEPNLALVFGNEHQGLSEYAIRQADKRIIIPMKGMVQSLNLSVTAAICMFETSRQRGVIGKDRFKLSLKTQSQSLASFLER